MKSDIVNILSAVAPREIAVGIVDAFTSVEAAFVLKQWKSGGLDAGHFVEMVRRFLDHVLLGSFVPIGASLSPLNEDELKRIASRSGHESYRILIPRVLFSIYSIRNKRGIGHVSEVTANAMDANLILTSCKWIISEVIRVCSNRSIEDTSSLVDKLSERYIDGFWSQDGVERILLSGLTVRQQILFYLFNKSPGSIDKMQEATGAGLAYIKRTLKLLDRERMVHYDPSHGTASLLPTGHFEAEEIIRRTAVT